MWKLSRSKGGGLFIVSLAVSLLAAPAWASTISSVRLVNGTDGVFTAGVTTNTANSGQIHINLVSLSAGETIRLELLDSGGDVVSGGIDPASVADNGLSPVGLPAIQSLPITFFHAGTGLQLRAVNEDNNSTATSSAFTVLPGTGSNLVVLAPGMTYVPGPSTSGGTSGSASLQQANQAFSITVHLTDGWNNQVTDNHTVSFASTDLISLPSPGALSSGVGNFNVTITAAKVSRTITVSDVTDASVQAGAVTIGTVGPPTAEVFPFPSPFNPAAGQNITFRFRLAAPAEVTLKVTTQLGQPVWEQSVAAGISTNDVTWDGRNDKGTVVAAGVYYVVLEVDGARESKKRFGVIK